MSFNFQNSSDLSQCSRPLKSASIQNDIITKGASYGTGSGQYQNFEFS